MISHFFYLATETVFWLACALIVYTYAGYPLLLFVVSSAAELYRSWRLLLQSSTPPDDGRAGLPGVSIVIAAHNEEDQIAGLLESLRQLDYPRDRLEVIVVSDGSTDDTDNLLQAARESWLCVLRQPHAGKATALNHAVERAHHDILVLLDASTRPLPNTLRQLAGHFQDASVGVVCGALRFAHHHGSQNTEGAYWSYECLLRLMEGRLGATLTASGALYAVRRACFPQLEPTSWIEDFLIPMRARRAGFRVLYDPEALAWETPASNVSGEFTRRVRLAVGSFRALHTLLRTRLDAVTRWAFVSHKLMRWSVPFLLIVALLANLALWNLEPYRALLLFQLGAYAIAWAGGADLGPLRRSKAARALYFFLAMNAAFFWGFVLFLRDRGQTAWQQVR